MMTHCKAAMLGLAVALAAGSGAKADLVIEGRASQALHCSAMLAMVSGLLDEAGMIEASDARLGMLQAISMLDYVPGTKAQKTQAMRQRFRRIADSRSLPDLFKEYSTTARWCNKNFPPKAKG